MPPKIMGTAAALAAMKSTRPKTSGATREKILRGMFERFENVSAWLRANGDGGAIVLPLPPRLTNGSLSGLHWTTQNEIKEAYWSHCDGVLFQKFIPKPPKEAPQLVRCDVRLFVARMGDSSNNSARRKWPEDWLVKKKFIHDDAPAHFIVNDLPPIVVPRKECRIEFRIEPLEKTL